MNVCDAGCGVAALCNLAVSLKLIANLEYYAIRIELIDQKLI